MVESRAKVETAILAVCLIIIVISGGSLYYISTLMSDVSSSSEDISVLTEKVEALTSITGTLAGTMGDLTEAVGEYSETIAALEEKIKAIEETIKPEHPEYRKTLVIATNWEPDGLDLAQIGGWGEMHRQICAYLVEDAMVEGELTLIPDQAESYEITDDGYSIIFYLPADLKYSNGKLITAETVKECFERYMHDSVYAEDVETVENIVIIDEHTVKFECSAPVLDIIIPFSDGEGPVLYDLEVLEEMGNETFNRKPVSTGQWKVKEWVFGSHITLERNDFYRTSVPFVENNGPNTNIDEVIFKIIPEDLTRLSEFDAGNVDILLGVPGDSITRLREDPGISLYEMEVPHLYQVFFNLKRPPLDDLLVRKAINYAINRDEIVEMLDGVGVPLYSWVSSKMLFYNASVEEYAADLYAPNIEKAKNLLEEADWIDTDNDGIVDKDGQPMKFEVLIDCEDFDAQKVCTLIQSQLAQAGIDLELTVIDWGIMTARRAEGDFDMFYDWWGWSDPGGILRYTVHSENTRYYYNNSEVDMILDGLREIPDVDGRTEAFTELNLILIEELPYIPVYATKTVIAVNKNVKGLHVIGAWGELYFNDVYIEK